MAHDELKQTLIWAGKVLVGEGQDDFTRGRRLDQKAGGLKPTDLGPQVRPKVLAFEPETRDVSPLDAVRGHARDANGSRPEQRVGRVPDGQKQDDDRDDARIDEVVAPEQTAALINDGHVRHPSRESR